MGNATDKKGSSVGRHKAHEKELATGSAHSGEYPPRIIDQAAPRSPPDRGEGRRVQLKTAREASQDYIRNLPPDARPAVRRYKLTDAAIKVVRGVGSVGTICGIPLMMSGKGEPLFLQFKQARQSVLEPYLQAQPAPQTSRPTDGDQTEPDAGRQRYVPGLVHRTRRAPVLCAPVGRCQNQAGHRNHEAAKFEELCHAVRRALARAHARSGDAAVLTGYMGSSSAFEDAVAIQRSLCRPERARSCGAGGRRARGQNRGAAGGINRFGAHLTPIIR